MKGTDGGGYFAKICSKRHTDKAKDGQSKRQIKQESDRQTKQETDKQSKKQAHK